MEKKKENETIIEVVVVILAVVFVIAVMMFSYLEKRNSAEQHQTRMARMLEISRDADASSRVRIESMTEILKAQIRRPLPSLQLAHVHSSTCGHPPHDDTEPYYLRLRRQRRR